MKSIVVIPTYNERDNIQELISTIRQEVKSDGLDILVVDSASPDETAKVVRRIQQRDEKLILLQQGGRFGLGKAYQEGMRWALSKGYDRVITMDADFSHHPRYLTALLNEAKTYELVIGSRYVPGGALRDWSWSRRVLSRVANWYARVITRLPFADLTSGFHCFQSTLLRNVLRYPLSADGYAFLIALKFLSVSRGARCKEIPIVFSDRTKGKSKISKRIILESTVFVWKCFFQGHRFNKRMRRGE